MVTVRTPNDEDEEERVSEAVRRGQGIPLEVFIEAIIEREPEEELVEAIRLGIEAQREMPEGAPPLDIKQAILDYVRWQEAAR
ncbi:MAG: hypothetical protein QF722_03460 [Candidatus Thalassarchaeaceae archaeon]|jgi:hypothetical protein|nr:hypothetical protein [Candidatus Thalassarchaeaceae archaeon]MDP6844592.1 hypothetical protein [Candidatus Thalassarchaeaceae archaeon]